MTAGSADARLEVPATRPVRAARTALVSAGILGVVADLTLRTAGDGLGWTLWVFSLAGTALHVGRRRGIPVSTEPIAWLAVAVTCAAAFAWRDAEALRIANVLGTLVAVSMFGMAASGLPAASVLVARLRDVVATGIYAARDVVAGAILLVARDVDLPALPAFRGGRSWTAVRALLLTLPVALVFVVLLSRADPVFASLFNLQAIDVERLLEHGVVIGAFAWWSAGWMRGALLGTSRRPAPPERLPVRLGLAEVTSLFGAVIALFSVFIALQLRWLFGGADVVLATTGLTVAEYARRGFFELVAVAALVIPLVLATRAVIEDDRAVERHRRLSLVLIVLLAAIMVSAMSRMRLYVGYFGLTTDRLNATVLMGWFGLVSVALARTATTPLLVTAPPRVATRLQSTVDAGEPDEHVFRREGDTWVLTYGAETVQLRDAKGLRYLALLLAQPGREVHVSELAGDRSGVAARMGPTDTVLDDSAALAYRERITELEGELEEAREWNDSERAARTEAELDAVAEQLAGAYGLGGRARTTGDPAERMRKAVTNRIKDSLGRISAAHEQLGRHLDNSVRTGTFCSYVPEHPTRWSTA